MTDTQEGTTIEEASYEEITELIAGLEQYRERLVSETLTLAQRAKVKKSQALEKLEPELAQIDANLQALRQRQATLNAG